MWSAASETSIRHPDSRRAASPDPERVRGDADSRADKLIPQTLKHKYTKTKRHKDKKTLTRPVAAWIDHHKGKHTIVLSASFDISLLGRYSEQYTYEPNF